MQKRQDAGDEVDPDRLFDAQRRVVEAKIEFFRARVEYAVAVKNVHLEKNSLMAYNNLQIYDGVIPLTVTSDIAGEEQLYQDQSKPLQSVPEEPPAAEVPETTAFEPEDEFEVGEITPVNFQGTEYSERGFEGDALPPEQGADQSEFEEEVPMGQGFTGE
jgi:hypothetical protein